MHKPQVLSIERLLYSVREHNTNIYTYMQYNMITQCNIYILYTKISFLGPIDLILKIEDASAIRRPLAVEHVISGYIQALCPERVTILCTLYSKVSLTDGVFIYKYLQKYIAIYIYNFIMAGEVIVDALPYIDQGYDEPGVREAVK